MACSSHPEGLPELHRGVNDRQTREGEHQLPTRELHIPDFGEITNQTAGYQTADPQTQHKHGIRRATQAQDGEDHGAEQTHNTQLNPTNTPSFSQFLSGIMPEYSRPRSEQAQKPTPPYFQYVHCTGGGTESCRVRRDQTRGQISHASNPKNLVLGEKGPVIH